MDQMVCPKQTSIPLIQRIRTGTFTNGIQIQVGFRHEVPVIMIN